MVCCPTMKLTIRCLKCGHPVELPDVSWLQSISWIVAPGSTIVCPKCGSAIDREVTRSSNLKPLFLTALAIAAGIALAWRFA